MLPKYCKTLESPLYFYRNYNTYSDGDSAECVLLLKTFSLQFHCQFTIVPEYQSLVKHRVVKVQHPPNLLVPQAPVNLFFLLNLKIFLKDLINGRDRKKYDSMALKENFQRCFEQWKTCRNNCMCVCVCVCNPANPTTTGWIWHKVNF